MSEPPDHCHDWEITVDVNRGFKSMRSYRGFRVGLRSVVLIVLALWAGTWGGILLLGIWIGGGL